MNPPVHALATLFCFVEERDLTGEVDTDFLEDAFLKLLLNFNWWVNRKDPTGANVFDGGVPGAGQHRGVRPQRPTANWRPSGAG